MQQLCIKETHNHLTISRLLSEITDILRAVDHTFSTSTKRGIGPQGILLVALNIFLLLRDDFQKKKKNIIEMQSTFPFYVRNLIGNQRYLVLRFNYITSNENIIT